MVFESVFIGSSKGYYAGYHFSGGGLRFEVADMDRNRIDKVLIESVPEAEK